MSASEDAGKISVLTNMCLYCTASLSFLEQGKQFRGQQMINSFLKQLLFLMIFHNCISFLWWCGKLDLNNHPFCKDYMLVPYQIKVIKTNPFEVLIQVQDGDKTYLYFYLVQNIWKIPIFNILYYHFPNGILWMVGILIEGNK